MLNLRDSYGGSDPILTTLAQGYALPETNIANFIAPVVDTPTRAGRILRFGKEQFAINDYRRAYGTNIPAVQSRFDSEPYTVEQEVIAWEIPEEVIENAGEGPAQVDLRAIETRNAMKRLMNSYEKTVADGVAVSAAYETNLAFATWTLFQAAYPGAGNENWTDPTNTSDPIKDVLIIKRQVANQIGIRPNSMVLGSAVYDNLLVNSKIEERIKYTTVASIDIDVIARYFGLSRGIRVAEGRFLETDGRLLPVFPENAILVFYSPLGPSDSVMPAGGVSMSTPAYAYTYQLTGTPAVRPEYFVRERRVVRAEITVERIVNLVGLGATGLIGSGFYIADILA